MRSTVLRGAAHVLCSPDGCRASHCSSDSACILATPPARGCHFATRLARSAGGTFAAAVSKHLHLNAQRATLLCPSASPYSSAFRVPEPVPQAASLPDEPPSRSELIDLTRAIKRCQTWQQLRQLYWANRTRQGAINVVAYFTRLAALLPDLPNLLATEAADRSSEGPDGAGGPLESEAEGLESKEADHGRAESSAQGGAQDAAGGPAGPAALRTASSGVPSTVGRRAGAATGGRGGSSSGRSDSLGGDGRRTGLVDGGRSRSSRSGGGGRREEEPPARLHSAVERAALRQLVVRMIYDACSHTREHVAAARLDAELAAGLDPWDAEAYQLYLAESGFAARARAAAYASGVTSGSGSASALASAAGAATWQAATRVAEAAAANLESAVTGREVPPGRQWPQLWRLEWGAQAGPKSFWEWFRDRPNAWVDPIAARVTAGLEHWDWPPPTSPAAPPSLALRPASAGKEPDPRAAEHGGRSAGTATGAAAAATVAAEKKRRPLCMGPLELATLAFAAARLQLHRVAPEHAAWLLHDLLYGSYGQMAAFDGRQLAQLSYSLAQLGPAEPPARWKRRFLAAARRRMHDMDSQSLANLSHSLEPLGLQPDPAWLRDLLAASGRLMAGPERTAVVAAELTQLAWAMFSARRRLYHPKRWASEVLAISRRVYRSHAAPVVPQGPAGPGLQGPPYASGSPSEPATQSTSQPGRGPVEVSESSAAAAGAAPSVWGRSGTEEEVGQGGEELGEIHGYHLQRQAFVDQLQGLMAEFGAPALPRAEVEQLLRILRTPPTISPQQLPGQGNPLPPQMPPQGPSRQQGSHLSSSTNQQKHGLQQNPETHGTLGSSNSGRLGPVDTAIAFQALATTADGPAGSSGPLQESDDPWVSDRAAYDLLARVQSEAERPEGALAAWLLRQPPVVTLAVRLVAKESKGSSRRRGLQQQAAATLTAGPLQAAPPGIGSCSVTQQHPTQQRLGEPDHEELPATSLAAVLYGGKAAGRSGHVTPQLAGPGNTIHRSTAGSMNAVVGSADFQRLPVSMRSVALLCMSPPRPGAPVPIPTSTPGWPQATTAAMATAGNRSVGQVDQGRAAVHALVSALDRGSSLSSAEASSRQAGIRSHLEQQQPPGPPLPSGSIHSLSIPPSLAPDSLACMLHSACWPSPAWLDSLAAAATARLRSPGFRAQSLGILLWSLAGLGFSPPEGWLQPWLQRASELWADFRPANLVSVLCALSTWGHVPAGRPAAALRAAAVRALPAAGPRELELAASALAQICELPLPLAPLPASAPALQGPAVPGGGSESDSGGGPARGRAGRGDRGGGWADGAGERSGKGRAGSSAEAAQRRGGGARGDVTVAGLARDTPELFVPLAVVPTVGAAASGGQSTDPRVRQRDIDPRVARLLVDRAVQVSYSYSPRHMSRLLRLLVLRLGCPVDPAALRAILDGHTERLEAIAAAAEARPRARQQRIRARTLRQGARRLLSGSQVGQEAPSPPGPVSREHEVDTGGSWKGGRGLAVSRRVRELRELGETVLDVARVLAAVAATPGTPAGPLPGRRSGGQGKGGQAAPGHPPPQRMSDEEAAALLPARWWRAYLAAIDAVS